MYKSLLILITVAHSLIATQCASTKEQSATQELVLSQPDFASQTIYFNSMAPGREEGETGYEIHFEQMKLPETITLEQVYFSNRTGMVQKKRNGYIARVSKKETDVVMSSDPKDEAANTPSHTNVSFPFTINESQVGVQYRDNGVVKYTLMSTVLQREPIYHPSRPRESKQ